MHTLFVRFWVRVRAKLPHIETGTEPNAKKTDETKPHGFGELVVLRASPSSVHTRWVPLGLDNLS